MIGAFLQARHARREQEAKARHNRLAMLAYRAKAKYGPAAFIEVRNDKVVIWAKTRIPRVG